MAFRSAQRTTCTALTVSYCGLMGLRPTRAHRGT